ncbi:MAG: ATP-binding protein [Desulfobacteraceae bacterium]|jgi:signal transduction histidine kinase/DNA-binding response OmpR family regulator|nr:ATP-binding protein [Desulfobacteraceae bacterium]
MADDILLVDRDPTHAEALRFFLERQGFKVFLAATFDELLLLFDNQTPQIMLAAPDTQSPETSYLLKKIKKTHSMTQIILLLDKDEVDAALEELNAEIAGFLVKPIKSHALNLALRQAKNQIALQQKIERCTARLEQLHSAQTLYQQLFDQVPCYISVQDRQFRLTTTNRMFKKDFGDAIGSYCYQIYKHRTSPCEQCPVAATFADGLSHQTEEIVTSKSGKQYNVLTWTAPIRDGMGRITQVMEMSTNITQIRQLQDHLTSLGLMLGSMSHGVKGMLTAMDGGIYQLETGLAKGDRPRIERAFEQVKQMAGHIRKMVLEILYYAKSRELRYESISVDALVQRVIDPIEPLAQKNAIGLEIDVEPNLGMIEIDPNWVPAALINFMENAVDACSYDRHKSEHVVLLKVFRSETDQVCFVIQDNGMGMDRETREKMFTLFFTSKGSQGTGLGLFIANRVIQQHGGHILVESKPQAGTRFQICLPRRRPEMPRVVDFPDRKPDIAD